MQRFRADARVAGELNRVLVFDAFRARRVISRAELARETGLSKGTISLIVDSFIRDGFVQTVGLGPAAKGRRPTLLRFDPAARYVVGLELSDSAVRAVRTDLDVAPLREAAAFHRGSGAAETVLATTDLLRSFNADLENGKLLGIGVGTPGLVDSRTGVIRMAPDLGWREVPVGAILAERFEVPVAVLNRAKAAALGEAWRGAGEGIDNLIYVSISTGIAAGIVIDQRLYFGESMSAGELGHTTVLPDGPLCACGNRGCLQTVAASPAILARARERLRQVDARGVRPVSRDLDLLTLEDLADAERAGDSLTGEVLDETAELLGLAAANLVNLFNPRMLVLGGSVVRALPTLVPRIAAVVTRRAMAVPASAVQVVSSKLGAAAVSVGAAAFILTETPIIGTSRTTSLRRHRSVAATGSR